MYFSHWLQEWAFRGSTAIDGLLPVNPSAHLIMGLQWVQKNDCFREQTAGYRSSHGSGCVGRHSLLRARLVWFEPLENAASRLCSRTSLTQRSDLVNPPLFLMAAMVVLAEEAVGSERSVAPQGFFFCCADGKPSPWANLLALPAFICQIASCCLGGNGRSGVFTGPWAP